MTKNNIPYQRTGNQAITIVNSLDQIEIIEMIDKGKVEEAVSVLSQTHNRLASILRFRLDKIAQDEREAIISHNWAERARNQIISELREQLEP